MKKLLEESSHGKPTRESTARTRGGRRRKGRMERGRGRNGGSGKTTRETEEENKAWVMKLKWRSIPAG